MQLNDIRLMNETMISYFKKIGADTKRNDIINEILKDEACFFKIEKADAYTILKAVGVEKNIDEVYSELISNDIFYDLYKKDKIKENDKEIIIKHKIYDTDNLFKQNTTITNENIITESAMTTHKETFLNKIINILKSILKRR